MANSCYSRYYFPLISGSTTIGASLIVFVKASLDILSLHIPDEPKFGLPDNDPHDVRYRMKYLMNLFHSSSITNHRIIRHFIDSH